MSFLEPLKYEELKEVYKMQQHSPSLFSYMLHNNEFNPNHLFHMYSKKELIEAYKKLTAKHLEILENL